MPTRRRPSEDSAPLEPGAADGDWNPDATPYVEGYDPVPDAVPTMVGAGVPAVVAVVTTRNPGPWLETALASIDAQRYANLTTLVIDAGSISDPTERVAEVLPGAFVKRLDGATYAETANAALGTIEGAAFFLFLHDDVELRAGAVQAMVEEAFRSNAGIVGAKLVDWDDPDHLRSVGSSIDKFGFEWPTAELNELDQGQHDAVRESFVVSTAAMLVRADLFADLGGFSTDIDGAAEDLDLCWRARVAGARTVVMPAAVARHRERSELGDPTGRAHRLRLRHQARVIVACYSPLQLLRVAPQSMLLAIVDMLAALVRGQVATAGDIVAAFGWNLAHIGRTLRIRARVQRSRRSPDTEIRRMQVKGSVRFMRFVRRHTAVDRTVSSRLAAAARSLPGDNTADDGDASLWGLATFVTAAVVLLVGSRTLITDGVPVVRELVPLGNPADLWAEWWAGWRTVGLGAGSGAPTLNAVAAVAGWVTFGSTGLVRTIGVLGPLALGAYSSWALFRGVASAPARAVAVGAFVLNPLPYTAIAEGRWQAIVAYSALPSIVGRVARAGEWPPFDRALPPPGTVSRQIVGLGLVLAAATTIAPVTATLAVVVAVVMCLAMAATSSGGRPARAVRVTVGALALSFALHLPWALAVVGSSNRWPVLMGAEPGRRPPIPLSDAMLLDTGSHGGALSAGLVVAAVAAILVGARSRLRWSVVAASFIGVAWAGVVVAGLVSPSVAMPLPEVTLSIAGVGVVVAAASGFDAFRSDVVGSSFGWRQMLSVVAVAAVAVAVVPFVGDLTDGRWRSPVSDTDTALRPIRSTADVPGFRTLWIGDADAIGPAGWRIRDGAKFALTDGVRATASSLFPPDLGPGERALRRLLRDASRGGVSRLGALLAPYGVRYVVVQERLAPLPYGTIRHVVDPGLRDALDQQFDLARVEVAPGLTVFENVARLPVRSTADAQVAAALAPATAATDLAEVGLPEVEPWAVEGGPRAVRGEVGADRTALVLSTRDDRWTLRGTGERGTPQRLFGWASRYSTGDGGAVTLTYATPPVQVLLHVLQLAVLVTLPWTRRRRVSEFRVRLSRSRSERAAS